MKVFLFKVLESGKSGGFAYFFATLLICFVDFGFNYFFADMGSFFAISVSFLLSLFFVVPFLLWFFRYVERWGWIYKRTKTWQDVCFYAIWIVLGSLTSGVIVLLLV